MCTPCGKERRVRFGNESDLSEELTLMCVGATHRPTLGRFFRHKKSLPKQTEESFCSFHHAREHDKIFCEVVFVSGQFF